MDTKSLFIMMLVSLPLTIGASIQGNIWLIIQDGIAGLIPLFLLFLTIDMEKGVYRPRVPNAG